MNENKRHLEGCEKLPDGRYRIREKMMVLPIKCNEPLNEKKDKIIVEGKEILPTHKFVFRIWNDDFNGNGRSYRYVIDRVIKENRPTFCLADHPSDGCDADSMRICGCGKNYRRDSEGWMVADVYLFGDIGDIIAQGFQLGVPAQVSSSVLGELDDENFVMDSDSFYLERICDILPCEISSNGIYHYADHTDHINDDYSFTTISEHGFTESTQKENLTILDKQNITESTENMQNDKAVEKESDDSIGEEKMPENTNDELIQQSMMLNIKSMIKDAESMDSPFDKKEALVSADGFAKKLTDDTLHVEICKKIEDTDNEIKELSAKGLQTDDLADKCKALEDENKKVSDELEALKAEKADIEEKLKTVTNMYEEEQYKASETELEKSEELEERNHRLSKELCSLKAKNRNLESLMRKNQRVLESKVKRAEAELNTAIDTETFLKCKNKCKTLEDENADLCKKIEDLENTIATMKKAEDAIDVEVGAEEILDLKKKLNEMIIKNNRLRRLLNEQRMSNHEKKESRFSKLRKNLEDEESDVIVDDEIIENEIADDDVIVTDNGISTVTEEDDDSFMEKALAGTL